MFDFYAPYQLCTGWMYFWKLRDWKRRTLPPPPQLRSNTDRQPASLQYSVADKTTHCCTWWHRHWCSLRMHGNCKKQRQKPKHANICKEYCRLKICRYVKTGVPSNNTSWCKTWWMRIHRKNVSKQELCKLAYFNYQTSHSLRAKMWFFYSRLAREDIIGKWSGFFKNKSCSFELRHTFFCKVL